MSIENDSASISMERLSGLWSSSIGPETRTTHTIQRQQNGRQVMKTLRTAKKVVNARTTTTGLPGMPPDYELIDKLGEGGMGVVYVARQTSIDRHIAIKMLKPDVAHDDDVRARFLAEAAVTGALDHPNIVPIHDLGTNEQGALFYAMKRVKGTPWCDCLLRKSLSENLEIWNRMCDAIAFAHSRGIIHRDLKPENVMLGDFGEVLVMDWGLAVSVLDNGRTAYVDSSESMAGTPAYMAPEMASGTADQLSLASDVYLCGAVLYEIVTGFPPHTGKNVMGCLFAAASNQIRKTDKTGELVEIAIQAMSTKPADRHASILELQKAVRTYQAHSESILLSSKASKQLAEAQQTDKYNDYAQALFGYREAFELWRGNDDAELGISRASLIYARSAFKKGDLDLATSLLDVEDPTHHELLREVQTEIIERQNRQTRLKWATLVAKAMIASIFCVIVIALVVVTKAGNEAEHQRKLADDLKLAAIKAKDEAVANEKKTAELLSLSQKQKEEIETQSATLKTQRDDLEQNQLKLQEQTTNAVKAREIAEYEAYLAQVGLAASKVEENSFRQAVDLLGESAPDRRDWEWGRLMYVSTRATQTYVGQERRVDDVAYAPNEKWIATASADGAARLFDAASGKLLAKFEPKPNNVVVHAVVFTPDSRQLVSAQFDGQILVWDIPEQLDGQTIVAPARRWAGSKLAVFHLEIAHVRLPKTPAAKVYLISCGADGSAYLWDFAAGKQVFQTRTRGSYVWSAVLSPQGNRLLLACQDGLVQLYALDSDEQYFFPGHNDAAVYAAEFLGENDFISAGEDKIIRRWSIQETEVVDEVTHVRRKIKDSVENPKSFIKHLAPVRGLRVLPDGKSFLSCSSDNLICLWNVPDNRLVQIYRGHSGWVSAIDYAPRTQHYIVSGSFDNDAKLWDLKGYSERIDLGGDSGRGGHAGDVFVARYSPDQKRVATGSVDDTCKLWNARTGDELLTLDEGHSAPLHGAIQAPNPNQILTFGDDGYAILWDRRTNGEVLRFRGHADAVRCAAYSHDGKWLATGSEDESIRISDAATGELKTVFENVTSTVTAIAFSLDDKKLIVGLFNNRVRIYDLATGTFTSINEMHGSAVNALVCTPDGKYCLTASSDNSSARFEIATGQEVRAASLSHGTDNPVTSVDVSSDGKYILTSDYKQNVRIWDANTYQVVRSFHLSKNQSGAHESVVTSARFSPDGKHVVSSGFERVIRVWDAQTGKQIGDDILKDRFKFIRSVSFLPGGQQLLVAADKTALIWDLESKSTIGLFERHDDITGLAFHPQRDELITVGGEGGVKCWDLATGRLVGRFYTQSRDRLYCVSISPDGKQAVTSDEDGRVTLWDYETRRPIRDFVGHKLSVFSCVFSPIDGKFVLTASRDATARVFETATGREQFVLRGHTESVRSANYDHLGENIITASADTSARVWSAKTGEQLHTLDGHTAELSSACFSPDGRRILTGSHDFTAKLWDADRAQEILTLKGHMKEVVDVCFSPVDGNTALTASRDRSAILWPAIPWKDGSGPEAKDLPAVASGAGRVDKP